MTYYPFEHDLAYIADDFAAQQTYAVLPTSREYRDFAEVMGGSARTLASLIAENRAKCTQLDREMRRQAQIPLLQKQQLGRPSVEGALAQLAALCLDLEQVQSPSGDRPRDALRVLARKLGDIWEKMTGVYCPTSVDRKKAGEKFDFYAEGPEFVLTVARVFDPSIQPAQIATALRKRPSRKGRRQSSPLGDGGNSAQNSN